MGAPVGVALGVSVGDDGATVGTAVGALVGEVGASVGVAVVGDRVGGGTNGG